MKGITVLILALVALANGSVVLGQREGGAAPGGRVGGLPGPQPPGETTASIRGRVHAADTGAPIRRAEILATTDQGMNRLTTTDDDGRYELRDLPAGEWKVTASKTGFVTVQFRQRRPFEVPDPIVVSPGERFTAADITLPRGGAISGRIFDEFGEPLAAVRVSVFRARMAFGRRRLQEVAMGDQTDDTGSFRVFGLAPGEYYVAASLRVAPIDSFIETTYAPTYFPGTGNLAEAQRVTLGFGENVRADFPVLPVRPARLSGIVLTSAGAPANALLDLASEAAELGVPLGVGGATLPDGTFTLPDVPPGLYTLHATAREDGSEEAAALPITIGTEPVTGITVITARGARLRGTFVPDDGVRRLLPEGLGVAARPVRVGGPLAQGRVSRNTFEIDSLHGAFQIDVEGLPMGWAVKAIIVNGVDVSDSPIDLRNDQNAAARIVLTDRTTEVGGTIAARGALRGHTVVVFSDDPMKWTYRSRHMRMVRADERGAFRISGLPPGVPYLAVALNYLEEGEDTDPEFLARMKGVATGFILADGERKLLDLRLVER